MLTVQPCMYFSEMKEFSKIALDIFIYTASKEGNEDLYVCQDVNSV